MNKHIWSQMGKTFYELLHIYVCMNRYASMQDTQITAFPFWQEDNRGDSRGHVLPAI